MLEEKSDKAAWHWNRALDLSAEINLDAALVELDAMPVAETLNLECMISQSRASYSGGFGCSGNRIWANNI